MVQTKKLTLRKNFSWVLSGRILQACSQLLLVMLIAKLTSPEILGLYGMAMAITTPVFGLFNIDLSFLLATEVKGGYTITTYLRVRFLSSIVATFVCTVFMFFSNFTMDQRIIVCLIAVIKAIEGQSDIVFGVFQNKERMDFMGKSMFLSGFLSIITIGSLLLLTKSLPIALAGMACSYTLKYYLYDHIRGKVFWQQEKKSTIIKDADNILRLLKLASPLGILIMMKSLTMSIPCFFIEYSMGTESVGFFTAMATFLKVGQNITAPLVQAVSPRMAQHYWNNIKQFIRFQIKLIFVGLGLGLGLVLICWILGEIIIQLIYSKEYLQNKNLLLILMAGGIALNIRAFLRTGFMVIRLVRIQLILFTIHLLTLSIACYFLIPLNGINGGGWALTISSWLNTTMVMIILVQQIRKRIVQTT